MSRNSKNIFQLYDIDFWPCIQGQTWRNAFTMISLVIHVIETCVWCPRLLNGCQGIQRNRSNGGDLDCWPWNSRSNMTHSIWYLWWYYGIYRRNLFLESISTKSISRNSFKYILMLWPWPLTLKIKVKHDNAINMITLVNVETYFGVHKYWIDVAELKKYISILWPWPLTLKFKVKHDVTHLIWLIW